MSKKTSTIKKGFYNLVLKIFIYTALSTVITYGIFFSTMSISNLKPTNHYVKYIDEIEDEINGKEDEILKGKIIDVKKYDRDIQGEVIDLSGNHLFGDYGVQNKDFNILMSINQDKYADNYLYRYISIMQDNTISAIYVIKVPFDFIINNYKSNFSGTVIYILLMVSPIIYFIIYLFLFTSKLYKSISKNVNILVEGAQKISEGDLEFKVIGTSGIEFNKIEEAFNSVVKVLRGTINNLSSIDEERRMMVSSIAHDIRTPITVIKGQIEIIEDLQDSSIYEFKDNMNIINKNCDRMITLTDNLSLLYKVEGQSFLFKNEKVNLKKLLGYKLVEIQSMTDKKNIKIEFKINLKKENYILDSNMLFRVIDNVLYNSLRFTKKGSITLEVNDDYKENHQINFKCIDTGSGFKQKDTDKLFTAFYQDKEYKNHFGLGLYIAQKIVKNYNGRIKAYNNDLNGATVEFFIRELN